ncbi:glycosyltransferase [Calothrix sp. NIES-3974]|uniref:glycosyltransferase n=1 Tax=Calothrix sp. NIES-3974 TaxID=2005462 RepID=UPI000B60A319|nr:glycosyltransferase [Calothrix sp. NIES-3974]BAZ03608.1 glycosyltransferase [Calothrix sp. NIES-3974]
MHFHVWTPNLFTLKGGILVYSTFFLQALQNLYPDSKYDVFLKHDQKTPANTPFLKQTHFHFAGSYPEQIRTEFFASQIIGRGILERPDLVIATHLHFAVAGYYLKTVTGVPYWAIAHGIEAWDIKNPILKKSLHEADRIICGSNYTREILLRQEKIDPAKISTLFNTFDHNRFQISSKPSHLLNRHNLQLSQSVILTVARLSKSEGYKGYDQILFALPRIRQSIPDVHYVIAGEGDDRERVEKIIFDLGIGNCVTLAGFVAEKELNDYYNLCDVFAMPSKKEGFGIVYLEALACGKPILAGNQDGAQDALCNGMLGVLVNPDDVEAIADKLIQILQKIYPNPLLYQPQMLRKEAINRFGFKSFQQTLGSYLRYQFS